jgi:hypothetical protein
VKYAFYAPRIKQHINNHEKGKNNEKK